MIGMCLLVRKDIVFFVGRRLLNLKVFFRNLWIKWWVVLIEGFFRFVNVLK